MTLRRARSRSGARIARAALALAIAVVPVGGARARGDSSPAAAPAPAFRPDGEDSWWGGDGRLHRLYRPKFVPAGELLDGARSILPPAVDLTLDPMRHRLLFAGTPAGVSCASEAVGYLDVPAPSASIDVTIVETARRRHRERGGHGVFDRDGPSAGPDTFFRSLRFDFEPESWLNSQLTGTDSFLGTSIHGGDPGTGGPLAGMVDVVLRSLSTEGEAEILANPSIVVTEGIPAYVASTIELPVTLFARSEFTTTYGTVSEHAGVRLEVTAVRIGADRLTLQIHPWVRQLTEAQGEDGPVGAPVLAVRELLTTVSLADGEEFLLGGVASWQRARDGVGLPVPPALAALTSALGSKRDDCACVELTVRVRARILHPGRDDARVVPPGEGDRLRRSGEAGRVPPPRAR